MSYSTKQEDFWAGTFGEEYTGRNDGEDLLSSNTAFFADILRHTKGVSEILELGANQGLNVLALRRLAPHGTVSAVEINPHAHEILAQRCNGEAILGSILDFEPERTWDLVFTKGVLIHIAPERLPTVYDLLYKASRRYVMVAEYFDPSPVALPYRGNEERLFKRDFAGEMLDRFPDLRVVDYRFVWRRDPAFPQGDLTWFLLEK